MLFFKRLYILLLVSCVHCLYGMDSYKQSSNLPSGRSQQLQQDFKKNPQMIESEGITPLMLACILGQDNVVKSLLSQGVFVDQKTNSLGLTAFMFAAAYQKLSIMQVLVDSGADINLQNCVGETALMEAAQKGSFRVVKWLLDTGKVVVDLQSQNGATVLMNAVYKTHAPIIKLLLEHGAKVDPKVLTIAVKKGNLDIIKNLVQKVAFADLQKHLGESLQIAAMYGHLSIVKYLVEEHILDVNQYPNGLLLAAAAGHNNIVSYFISVGAKLNVQSKKGGGITPLMLAAFNGHYGIVKNFIDNDAQVDLGDNSGTTALMCAANQGQLSIVKLLIEKCDVCIDRQDINGKTALMYAAQQNKHEVLKYLVKKGAKINLTNKRDETALMVAAFHDRSSAYKTLKELKADSTIKNADGLTALDVARTMGSKSILTIYEAELLFRQLLALDEGPKQKTSKKRKKKKNKRSFGGKNNHVIKNVSPIPQPFFSTSQSNQKAPIINSKTSLSKVFSTDYAKSIAQYKIGNDGSFVEDENSLFIQISDIKNNQKLRLFKTSIGALGGMLFRFSANYSWHKRVKRWFESPSDAVEYSEYNQIRNNLGDETLIKGHNFGQAVDQFVATLGQKVDEFKDSICYEMYGQLLKGDSKKNVTFEYTYNPVTKKLYHRLMRVN